MSDVKFCSSCGTRLSVTALFCHNCGQKQEILSQSEPKAAYENTEQSFINDNLVKSVDESSKTETISDDAVINEGLSSNESKILSETLVNTTEEPLSESDINVEPKYVEEIAKASSAPAGPITVEPDTQPQSQEISETVDQKMAHNYPQPQVQQPNTYQPQSQTLMQPQYNQTSTPQQEAQTQQGGTDKAVKKKKFPWFFSALWLIMFVAVGVWAYMFFIHPTYKYPILTEDAQRYVIFTVAVASLVYTLSLKLTMKKLKAIPSILIVLLGLVIFYFFCMVELQDGDILHDAISNLIESVIPASGN